MGNVTLTGKQLGISVTVLMGEGSPKIGGLGGVEQVTRINHKPLTTGGETIPLLTQTFQIVVDGYPDRIVEADVVALERLAGLDRKKALLPVISIAGPALRFTNRKWMIDSLEVGDNVERDDAGRLLRQDYTITLVEANVPEGLVASKGTGVRTVKVRKNSKGNAETLKAIAARELGSPKKWKTIAKYNGRTKAGGLKVGQKIRIPAS